MDEFEVFVRDVGPSMSRLAYLLCGDRGHAEDLTQVALLKAHQSWARVRAADYPAAYVRQILLREFLSWRRRRWTSELPASLSMLDSVERATGADPGVRSAEVDAVRRLLASLPRKQRAVLVMRYFLDLPEEQIASEVGCSRSTVRSIATRALQTLRDSAAHSEGVDNELH